MKEQVGQLFFVGIEGAQLSEEERKWLSEFSPGGILLLPRNIKSPHQLFTLCQELKKAATIPPFIAIDQEGGIVDRLSPFTPSFPSNLALGATGNADYAHRQGMLTARL
ncbi:MAG: beta-N-acetylhexosaminidase, partial [Candidatus Aminicenantes bacterium]|nr:beta-N-acetylhexosaminidase [Candidatus Aminicenantes bacterium]